MLFLDKTQQFFDPYNFSMQSNIPHANMQPNDPAMPNLDNPMNPAMYYDQQYMYYKYLTQMVDYKIKLKELEKLNNSK